MLITGKKEGMFVSSSLSCTVPGRRVLKTYIKKMNLSKSGSKTKVIPLSVEMHSMDMR